MQSPDNGAFCHELKTIGRIVERGPDVNGTLAILFILGIPGIERRTLLGMDLQGEGFVKRAGAPFSEEERYITFLWDAFERSPLSVPVNFAVPFRRILARRLFRRCGKNFCAGSFRFSIGRNIAAGNDVIIDSCTFIDATGGVTLGDGVGIGSFAGIFTHTPAGSCHAQCTMDPVVIGNSARIADGVMIAPGVTIGERAVVAAGSVVTCDVPEDTVVTGIPAQPVRLREGGCRDRRDGKGIKCAWHPRSVYQEE